MQNAKLIMVSIPASNVDGVRDFYSQLLGTDFAAALTKQDDAYHAPASSDGIDFQIGARHSPQETPMAHFAVDDLQGALQQVGNLGGKVIWGPEQLLIDDAVFNDYAQGVKSYDTVDPTKSVGSAAVVQDPDGGTIGLVQLEPHAHKHFGYGKHRKPLSAEQQRILQEDVKIGKKLKK